MAPTVNKITPYTPASFWVNPDGQSTYFTNQFRGISQAFTSIRQILEAGALGITKKAGVPTTADLPAGAAGLFKDTSGGGVYLAYNDAGTIKKVALT